MGKATSKILSVLLILTLTIANSSILLSIIGNKISYASGSAIETQSKTTNNKNVEFDAFFLDSGNNIKHKSEIKIGEKQKVYINVNIKDNGYIKNGYIEFTDLNGGVNLNYALSTENSNNDKLQGVSGYKVDLKQLNVGSFVSEIIINGNIQDRIPLEYLNGQSRVVFKGVYVDVNGAENNIEKEIKLETDLKSNYNAILESKLVNYQVYDEVVFDEPEPSLLPAIVADAETEDSEPVLAPPVVAEGETEDSETGLAPAIAIERILEIEQQIEIRREQRELPVAKTTLEITVPKIQNSNLIDVAVIAKDLSYTNGQKDENIVFGKSNYSYDEKTGKLKIEVENNNENGVWAGIGSDKYVVIYKYKVVDEITEVSAKNDIDLVTTTYENTKVNYSVKDINDVVLTESKNGKIENGIEAITKEVSKGKMYANTMSDKKLYDTEYSTQISAIVKDTRGINKIQIQTNFDSLMGETSYSTLAYYKTIRVLKSNMDTILGQDGTIAIKDETGIEVGRIDKNTKIENGYYKIDIIGAIDGITIETSAPQAEGVLYLLADKALSKNMGYAKADLMKVNRIVSSIKDNDITKECSIALTESETKVTLNLNKSVLTQSEEGLEIAIDLNNNNDKSDLYKNPRFRVELPSYIEDVQILNTSLVFDNGELEIADSKILTNQNGKKEIEISLKGTQTEFVTANNEKGTTIILNLGLKLKEGTNQEDVRVFYINENATKYASEVEQLSLKAVVGGTQNEEPSLINPPVEPVNKVFDIKMFSYLVGQDILASLPSEEALEEGAGELTQEEMDEVEGSEPLADGEIVMAKDTILYAATIKNTSDSTINNTVASVIIPDGLTYAHGEKSYIQIGKNVNYKDISYNDITKVLTFNIGNLEPNKEAVVGFYTSVNDLTNDIHRKEIYAKLSVVGAGTEEHVSSPIKVVTGKQNLTSVANIQNAENKYKPGEKLVYGLQIKNIGSVQVDKVNVKLTIPEELNPTNLNYKVSNGDEILSENLTTVSGRTISIDNVELPSNGILTVELELKVNELNEKIENYKQIQIKANVVGYERNYGEDIDLGEQYVSVYEKDLISNVDITNANYVDDPADNYKVSGIVWNDENENGQMDIAEARLSDINVKVINPQTGAVMTTVVTDKDGRYEFKKLNSGDYIVSFEYDQDRYELATYKREGVDTAYSSKVVRSTKGIAITESINILDKNISGINMGLVKNKFFDLKLAKGINRIILQSNRGTQEYTYNKTKLAKIEIPAKELSSATVLVEYVISVENVGEIRGIVPKVVDYIPSNMAFSSSLNPNWYQDSDGNLYNEELENIYINPGESKELRLVLTKKMTETNTGIVNNTAEIYEAKNEKELQDINSTPKNKVQGENDMSSADCIIGVKTGQEVLYISVVIISIIILGTGLYLIKKKVI